MNMDFKRKLPIPKEVKENYPLKSEWIENKNKIDLEIKNIFDGKSNKKLIIVGPCSADNIEAVIEYVKRLSVLQKEVEDKLILVPRIYTAKPRTTGIGYKGLLHQPNPEGKQDLLNGLITCRKLFMDVLESGMVPADEMLYPENHRYFSDCLSYVAVGARSVEDQQHRLTASGLDIPVGMKNPLSGDLNVLINSIKAARVPHTFLYRGWEVVSNGNPYVHAVLRGYVDQNEELKPNYDSATINRLLSLFEENKLDNPSVIIDCNHANSNKDFLKQASVVSSVIDTMKQDLNINKFVKGFMIESYLEDGCQAIGDNIYGKSITDPCLGWEKTAKLILDIYNKI